jgi:hypothetical protein
VIDAAFDLLSQTKGPVLEEFPEEIHDEADQPVACPLPPRYDRSVPAAVDEARGLRPAWERARKASGASQTGRVVGPDEVPDAIAAFIRVTQGTAWAEAGAVMLAALEAIVRADPSFHQLWFMAPWSQQTIVPLPGYTPDA